MATDIVFDKYVIDKEPIGEGAFGIVYRATDTKLKVARALKFLHPMLAHNAKAVSNFVREAQHVAKLAHPNIITVHDVVQDEDRYAIVMSLAAGGSLAQHIAKDGPIPPPQTLAILRQVVAGLSYAHQQGCIHCDIKPQNILFDSEGNVLLSDFGLAKLQSEQVSSSAKLDSPSENPFRGTYSYIAPEIWDGATPSRQTDSYALACTVYEMLVGRVLFQGSTPMAILRQHAKGPELAAIANTNIRAVLMQALDANPARRILPKQLLDEFEQATLATTLPHKIGKRTTPILWIGLGAIGLVAGATFMISQMAQTPTSLFAIPPKPTATVTVYPTQLPTETPKPTFTATLRPTLLPTDTPKPSATPRPTSIPIPAPLRDIPIKINDRTDLSIEEILPNFVGGDFARNGVRFNIPAGGNNRFATQCPNTPNRPASITIANLSNNGIQEVEQIFIIINAGWTTYSKYKETIGYVTLSFANGTRWSHNLVLGENIREWLIGAPNTVNSVSSPNSSPILISRDPQGIPAVLDMLRLDIPLAYRKETLKQISVIDATSGSCIFFAGITVRARD
ncbi:MAG: serine/threonine protein kinase [Anaerolineae bacterium]|nr:serine/threonine protein kinase [Anaerolineae bacterium]